MKELRLLDAHLVRSLFTCGAIPPLILPIRSHPRQDRRVCAWMLLSRSHPVSGNFGGDAKLSHVRREPLRLCPAPSTPVEPPRQVLTAFRFCPRCFEHEDLDIHQFIGIHSHGFSTRCLRFVPPSRTTTQDSLQCGDHPFTAGPFTRWVPIERFSCDLLYVISHPPRSLRLHGATERLARHLASSRWRDNRVAAPVWCQESRF
jgi:hypothetical protein